MRNIYTKLIVIGTVILLSVYLLINSNDLNFNNRTTASKYSDIAKTNDVNQLLSYLKTSDPEQANFVIWRLKKINTALAVNTVIDIWEHGYIEGLDNKIFKHPIVRIGAASALLDYGYFNSKDCIDYIYQQLVHGSDSTKLYAISALSSIANTDTVGLLDAIIKKELPASSIRAVNALFSIAIGNSRRVTKGVAIQARSLLNALNGKVNDPEIIIKINSSIDSLSKYPLSVIAGLDEHQYLYLSDRVYPRTLKLLLPYAKDGDANAQYYIANIYFKGIDVDKDIDEGFKWLHMAINNGSTIAMIELSRKYADGIDIKENDQEAARYLRLAASHGDPTAQIKLSQAYSKGLLGLQVDHKEADFWLNKASENDRVMRLDGKK